MPRGSLAKVAGVVAALLLLVATGFTAKQYTARAHVQGHGAAVWRTDRPTVRLDVSHAGNLRDVEVVVDGTDLSQWARVDGRGIVLRGLAMHDGWHHVQIRASQSGIFGGRIEGRYALLVDTTAPKLDLLTDAGYRTSPVISGTTEKGATVTASWRGQRVSTWANRPAFVLRPKLPQGPSTVRVSARDRAGNRTVRLVRLVLDTKAPRVTVQGARGGVVDTRSPTLRGRIDDASPVGIVATFDGESAKLRTAPNGRGAWSLPLETLAEGVHRLRIQATDAAGNVTTVSRAFTVDSTDTLSDDLTLQSGARGEDVTQLERRLDREGYWHGPYTRFYNQRTIAAVKAFQRGTGLVPDGVAGPAVIAATNGRLVVHLHEFRVYFMRGSTAVFSAPIAIGQPAYPTPVGHWSITSKIENPTWIPPNSPWAAGLEPVPPGVSNPLGSRWIGTSAPNIGFHATNEPSSVGHPVSHGCMRMYTADVERLYSLVSVGMPVDIEP